MVHRTSELMRVSTPGSHILNRHAQVLKGDALKVSHVGAGASWRPTRARHTPLANLGCRRAMGVRGPHEGREVSPETQRRRVGVGAVGGIGAQR